MLVSPRSARRIPAALLLSTAVIGAAGVIAPVPSTAAVMGADTVRLLANSGFESDAGKPESWSGDLTSGAVTIVDSPVRSGRYAARLVDTSSASGVSLRSAPVAVLPGEGLTASVWLNRTSGSGGWLYLEFWRADGTRTSAFSSPAGGMSGWQQVSIQGVTPNDAVTATVLAYSSFADTATTVWDDVELVSRAPGQRRVPDAGFEGPRENPKPTEWSVYAPGGSATVVNTAAAARTGVRALQMVDASSNAEVSALSRAVPVSVGETVTASAWAKRISGTTGTLYLEFRDAAGVRLAAVTDDVDGVSGWQQLGVTGTAPAKTTTLTVRLYSRQSSTGATMWDDVSLQSSTDRAYDPTLAPDAVVLAVGDQRIESYSGVSRVMHPGTKDGDPAQAGVGAGVVLTGTAAGTWDANPRISGSVLREAPGYRMWYTTSSGTGLATSVDGRVWSRDGRTTTVTANGNGGVVRNPTWTPGGPQPQYFTSRSTSDFRYHALQSADGVSWTAPTDSIPINGWDVVNVTWDPATQRFVAMLKYYPVSYPSTPTGPRTVWVSTSADYKTWTAPQPAFAADHFDNELITDAGTHGVTPWSEIYGMPAIRYGDQYLGLPWVFDIINSPNPVHGDPGFDKGRQKIQLAASRDLVNWSRPNRDELVARGPEGSWDWGFNLTSTTMQTVTVGGQQQTWLYYSSFSGEHSCLAANVAAGDCRVAYGRSNIGRVIWPADRFVSFRAANDAGTVTTRPLAPAGNRLTVNFEPGGPDGSLIVEVLDRSGNPIPGYGTSDATPVTTDSLAPGVIVHWGDKATLPTDVGPLRLRFTVTNGDLYAFTVN